METLTNQEFTYREVPVDYDGTGTIADIKGNTIVWNQLVKNGNFADTSVWRNGAAYISGGKLTLPNRTDSGDQYSFQDNIPVILNHTYYYSFVAKLVDVSSTGSGFPYFQMSSINVSTHRINSTNIQRYSGMGVCVSTSNKRILLQNDWGAGAEFSYVMVHDLTAMGLDNLSLAEVEQWFSNYYPLPYYDYCQGSLISFGGRMVNFNQLVQNGNFADDTTNWAWGLFDASVNNNILTLTATSTNVAGNLNQLVNFKKDHKYLFKFKIKPSLNTNIQLDIYTGSAFSYTETFSTTANTWFEYKKIVVPSSDSVQFYVRPNRTGTVGSTYDLTNFQIIDLTAMFGAGNEPSIEGFESLFKEDYYSYTTGRTMNLVSDVGLKTTGKNLFDKTAVSVGYVRSSDGTISASSGYRASDYIRVIPNAIYHITNTSFYGGNSGAFYDGNKQFISGYTSTSGQTVLTIPKDAYYFRFTINYDSAERLDTVQFGFGSTIPTYEPYITNTLSLPISQHFPDGMDGVGTAYDEHTPTDYYKRVGRVVFDGVKNTMTFNGSSSIGVEAYGVIEAKKNGLTNLISNRFVTKDTSDTNCIRGRANSNAISFVCPTGTFTDTASLNTWLQNNNVEVFFELYIPLHNYGILDLSILTWTYYPANTSFFAPIDDKMPGTYNLMCSAYRTNGGQLQIPDYCIGGASTKYIYISDPRYTDVASLVSALSGVKLLYEKETPEQIDLDLTYPIWDNGTEQLLPENTSVPVTTPILCDIDYRGMIPVNAEDDPDGSGIITGTGDYRYHSTATLTALPTDEIYRFLRWEDENGQTLSTDPVYTFEVGDDE